MKTISTKELQRLREKKQSVPIINVLPNDYFAKQHIAGSVNIPLEDENFVSHVEDEVGNKAEPVVVYCASTECDASPKAAKQLEEAGFNQVLDYEEGMKGWKDAGLPVVEVS
jgi:rhodanese-related sulfurtransferase